MKNFFLTTIIFLILGISITYAQEVLQDVVYLKNGSIIHGIIVEQIPNENIKIKTKDGNISVIKMSEVQKIAKENIERPIKKSRIRMKSPILAFSLSLFTPGAGQFYNGQVGKGLLQFGVTIPCAVIAILNADDPTNFSAIASGIAGTAYLWSVIDAPISANKINKKHKSKYGHLFEYENGKKTLGIDLGMCDRTLTTERALHF
jgi:TM2 domain-containing membrane protein YozV